MRILILLIVLFFAVTTSGYCATPKVQAFGETWYTTYNKTANLNNGYEISVVGVGTKYMGVFSVTAGSNSGVFIKKSPNTKTKLKSTTISYDVLGFGVLGKDKVGKAVDFSISATCSGDVSSCTITGSKTAHGITLGVTTTLRVSLVFDTGSFSYEVSPRMVSIR